MRIFLLLALLIVPGCSTPQTPAQKWLWRDIRDFLHDSGLGMPQTAWVTNGSNLLVWGTPPTPPSYEVYYDSANRIRRIRYWDFRRRSSADWQWENQMEFRYATPQYVPALKPPPP